MTAWAGVLGRSSRRRRVAVAAVLGLTVFAAACTSTPAAEERAQTRPPSTESKAPPKPAVVSITPVDTSVDVAPGDPVVMAAKNGKLTQYLLTNPEGKQVAGTLSPDGSVWQSAEALGFGKTYTASAIGEGSDGKPVTLTSTFSTVTPRVKADLSMNPLDGQTVGVGQPLAFYFDTKIADRAAAEAAIQITTTPPVEGDFHWFDDKQVHWRPKDYWPAGTQVSINAAIYGKNFGNGIFGNDSRSANVVIGDAVVATADGATHQMTVSVNGQVARTIPISMGKPGHETPSGVYVVMSEHTNYTMDSGTYGVPADSPAGYRTTVDVATRLSNSGIFYHSAPWSVGDQGNRNVSHGCINMTTEAAAWLQSISNKGDVVIIQNSGGPVLEPWDGLGDWQIPWEQWIV